MSDVNNGTVGMAVTRKSKQTGSKGRRRPTESTTEHSVSIDVDGMICYKCSEVFLNEEDKLLKCDNATIGLALIVLIWTRVFTR